MCSVLLFLPATLLAAITLLEPWVHLISITPETSIAGGGTPETLLPGGGTLMFALVDSMHSGVNKWLVSALSAVALVANLLLGLLVCIKAFAGTKQRASPELDNWYENYVQSAPLS